MSSEEVFVFRASFAQQRLWFLDQLIPGNTIYNVPTAIRLTGLLNCTALQQALQEIVCRHETLRTRFGILEGGCTADFTFFMCPSFYTESGAVANRETRDRSKADCHLRNRMPF